MTLGNGYLRLTDLDRERGQLEAKRRLAVDNGANPEQLALIDQAIAAVKQAIAAAAVAEAQREAVAAQDEAGRLAQGRPPKPNPQPNGPGDPDPPKPDDKDDPDGGNGANGGGGGGGGGTGNGFPFGIPPAPPAKGDSVKIPDGQCIYVRSESIVWAWSRYEQAWKPQDFASSIISIETVGGGILVIARHRACLFDASLCQWLSPLVTTEVLVTGQAAGTVPGISVTPATPAPAATPVTPEGASPGQPEPAVPGIGSAVPLPAYPVGAANVPPNPMTNPGLVIDPEPPVAFPEPPPASP